MTPKSNQDLMSENASFSLCSSLGALIWARGSGGGPDAEEHAERTPLGAFLLVSHTDSLSCAGTDGEGSGLRVPISGAPAHATGSPPHAPRPLPQVRM